MRIFAQDKAFYHPLRIDPTEDRQAEQRLAPAPHRRDPTRPSVRPAGLSHRRSRGKALTMSGVGASMQRGCAGWWPAAAGRGATRAGAGRSRMQGASSPSAGPWCGKLRITRVLAERHPRHARSQATVGRIL